MTSPQERRQTNQEELAVVEGMSPIQLEAVRMMLTAEVDGKLVRRYGEPGSFAYPEERGRFPMITIAQNNHEFVGAANLKEPQNHNIPLLNYFINLRGGKPEDYEIMARLLANTKIPFKFDYVTGIPTTGNLIAEPLATLLGVPYHEILQKPTSGVDRKFTAGGVAMLPSGLALVVDDLITGAATKLDAEAVLDEAGLNVGGHVVVVDRQEGGMNEMRKQGKNIVAGVTATQIFSFALINRMTDQKAYERAMSNIKV